MEYQFSPLANKPPEHGTDWQEWRLSMQLLAGKTFLVLSFSLFVLRSQSTGGTERSAGFDCSANRSSRDDVQELLCEWRSVQPSRIGHTVLLNTPSPLLYFGAPSPRTGQVLDKTVQPILAVAPEYPASPTIANSEPIRVRATVGKDGLVKKTSILSGDPAMAGALSTAVMMWRYLPMTSGGQPVEFVVEVEAPLAPSPK
jgi:hypothetical protein